VPTFTISSKTDIYIPNGIGRIRENLKGYYAYGFFDMHMILSAWFMQWHGTDLVNAYFMRSGMEIWNGSMDGEILEGYCIE
jgi:hypothetical protein